MTDIFQEVEEQLRSDRYKTLALKALPWVGGVLVLALVVALGFWGFDKYRSGQNAKASETYQAALDTLQKGDTVVAYAGFDASAKAGSKAYRSLALMQQGGIRLGERKPKEAVALFDEAAGSATTPLIGDLARLQGAYALLDTANMAELEGRLVPLTQAGRPFRTQAREALAMARLMHGQTKAAREDFGVLATALDTPNGVRQRAQAAQALIDSGGAANIAAIVKAADALPADALLARAPQTAPQSTPPAGAGQ